MKVAIVHELLTRRGGAERVAKIFADMFPEAPIYTLLYEEKRLGDWFPKERVRVGIEPGPGPGPIVYNHHLYLKKFPKVIEAWDFHDYDLVLSSSSAFAHGIITNGKPKHICYVHSPARYLWDSSHEVLDRAGKGPLGFLKKKYLEQTFHKLRIWDSETADRPDVLLANSKEIQRRIELYWRRDSEVVHPPIEDFWFEERTENREQRTKAYYLIVSTLTPYKKIDLAIDACNQAKLLLKIVGEGPDRKRLEKRAGETVEFLGYRSNEEVRDLYGGAQALIFPGEDDFGLVPVEAMACGTPVIAYGKGGVTETVVDGETGVFFGEQTVEALLEAIEKWKVESGTLRQSSGQEWKVAEECRKRAGQFSKTQFEKRIQDIIEKTTI